ncbi:hypothetical protein JY651_32255 [Pyxidicoccus parkwayensis]|uniref:Uncharacterized protein n=1 Tax=Pyxidicoccus parkwayensis TaxID=2813578 RepID=A0ABX7NM32_9BACT|nr:hypothetical protein [Pyxidicoccus parkwaysis]QSQ19935.1 hypothetical protein JY651_32255 [Pyxidicoccus parkwaysis]
MKRPLLLLASLSAALSLTLGTFQTVLWNGAAAPRWARTVAHGIAESALPPRGAPGAEHLAAPPAAYFMFGRPFILAYVALGLALVALARAEGKRRDTFATALVAVAALADVGVYWLSSALGVAFRERAFWNVEVPALVGLLFLVSVRAGLAWRRDGRLRPSVFALPLALLATAALHYMPHGPVLGLSFALLLEAARLRSTSMTSHASAMKEARS